MDQETINPEVDVRQEPAEASSEHVNSETNQPDPAEATSIETDTVQAPDFNEMVNSPDEEKSAIELNRLNEVKVVVAAELGRTNLPIQELLKLSEGSVVELNRSIESPVELIAQGLPLANGEVVVMDEKFAIRIKEVYSNS